MGKVIYVVGGDLRQRTVLKLLKEDGYDAFGIGLFGEDWDRPALLDADVVILPLPASYDSVYINSPLAKEPIKIDDILDNIKKDTLVLGACLTDELKQKLKDRGILYFDYYDREELIIKNAIPTAEGALEIALSEMPITLFESRVLVVGYGRVGKITADRFAALGAKVTVSARKCADFAWIEQAGMKAIHTSALIDKIESFDLIINTVPSMILDKTVLARVSENTLIIDLASKPGGVDFNIAKELGKNVIWALSLPGKTAPITSGKIIKETILNILSETGV